MAKGRFNILFKIDHCYSKINYWSCLCQVKVRTWKAERSMMRWSCGFDLLCALTSIASGLRAPQLLHWHIPACLLQHARMLCGVCLFSEQVCQSLKASKFESEQCTRRATTTPTFLSPSVRRHTLFKTPPVLCTCSFIGSEKVNDAVACSVFIPLECCPPACEGQGPLLYVIKNSVFPPPTVFAARQVQLEEYLCASGNSKIC